MNEFKFACPHCHQSIQATPEYAGVQINCPSCKAPIVVPQGSAAAPAGSPGKGTGKATGIGKGKLSMQPSTVHQQATSPVQAAAAVRRKKKPPVKLYIGIGVGVVLIIAAAIGIPKGLDAYHEHQAKIEADKKAAEEAKRLAETPPELTAEQILKKLGDTYRTMTAFSAQGECFGTIDMSAIMPALKTPQQLETKMSLRLGRPNNYRLEWDRGTGKQEFKGAAWNAGKGDFVHVGGTVKEKDREANLMVAATTSSTLGTWIAALFFDETNSLATAMKDFQKTGTENVEGQKCYVLSGELGFQKVRIWVRESDSLVAQTEFILGNKIDDSMLAGLTLAQKGQIEKASKMKGSFIETYQEMQTNQPMNAGAFESSFPPTANMQRPNPKPQQTKKGRNPPPR